MANKEHYYQFIEEVFINPIRSVLIIDDDYPTLDEVLNAPTKGEGTGESERKKGWHSNPDRVYNVIRKFRERSNPLLVDVSDGTSIPAEPGGVSHLHQSDLLVLDYALDKALGEDGTRTIGILRQLMSNRHFNLVVVYTQIELDKVFDEMRWGLIDASTDYSLSPEEEKEAEELIEQGEGKDENFEQKLRESLIPEGYFYSRLNPKKYLRDMAKGEHPYSVFCDRNKEMNWDSDQRKFVLRYLLKKIERENRSEEDESFKLSWSTGPVKWIKSDSAFVAFSKKSDDNDLISELQSALNNWCPKPSRLFLAKIRAEMDESGFAVQEQALGSDHAAAYWYNRLLSAGDETERGWLVAESVSRHSDQLMDIVLRNVEDFVMRLAEAEIANQEKNVSTQICKNRFHIDLEHEATRSRAAIEHNEFVCSKKPEGWHLTTGHVFSVCDVECWVCLSSACDMVPSQVSNWNKGNSGDNLPFIAVRLQDIPKDSKTLEYVRTNRVVVLKIGNEIKGFSFNHLHDEGSAPRWNLLYAENKGKFENDFRFNLARVVKEDEKLIFKSCEAKVIGQLRYEYALNLVQKLGVSLTRVGLDFFDGKRN